MKRGITKGLKSGCCSPFEVWGVSVNCPPFLGLLTDRVGPMQGGHVFFPYALFRGRPGNYGAVQIDLDPELWTKQPRTWGMYPAKIPSSYPYNSCEGSDIISEPIGGPLIYRNSQGEPDGLQMCILSRHYEEDGAEFVDYWRHCFASRAIYVDGKQKYIAYRYGAAGSRLEHGDLYETPHAECIGEISVININEASIHATANIDFLNHLSGAESKTYMEELLQVMYTTFEDTFNFEGEITPDGKQPPANCISIGKDYSVFSSYSPNLEPEIGAGWMIARIKYNGTRKGVPDSLEVFCSNGDLGKTTTPYYTSNAYVIVLPSCRVYMDSSFEPSGSFPVDECWVCAKTVNGSVRVITSQWFDKRYRIGHEGEETGYADGTLTDTEVSHGNIILDSTAPPPIPGETWDGLKIWCYNRVYDARTQTNRDLLLLTTNPGSGADTDTPTATFEDGDLNAGLQGISFVSTGQTGAGTSGNNWMPTTNDYYADEDSDDQGWSATTNNNVQFEGTSDLSITFTVTGDGPSPTFRFRYRLDNRKYGIKPDGTPDFTFLSNFAEPDNNLQFWLDGDLLNTVDNINFPEGITPGTPEPFEEWREYSVDLEPGTHTFRWTLSRKIAYHRLVAWVDHVEFPEILVGDDYNGLKRYFYNGEKIQEARWWAWARRNEEGTVFPGTQDPLSSRAATIPHFITLDKLGRILYGNSHYVVCLKYDDTSEEYILDEEHGGPRGPGFEGQNGGYLRLKATPNTESPTPLCTNPDLVVDIDVVDDPNWGGFQILPSNHGYQLRGANASPDDATNDPLGREAYIFREPVGEGQHISEVFQNKVSSKGRWSQRISCWTITQNGKELTPHLEVIWRPTFDTKSWPETPAATTPHFPVPPYQSTFDDRLGPTEWSYTNRSGNFRPRDPLQLSVHSNKPRWPILNYVIPRGYSDALSRGPQLVWSRLVDDPVLEEDWYDPDSLPEHGFPGGPWTAAQWRLVQSRFCPCGWRYFAFNVNDLVAFYNLCPDEEEEEVTAFIAKLQWEYDKLFWCLTDFDVADCDCDCCR